MKKLKFDPENGFLDSSKYPDPQNETEGREQLYSLHRQTKDFLNTLIDEITTNGSSEMNGSPQSETLLKPDGTSALSVADQISALDRKRVISDDFRFLGLTSDGNFRKSNDGQEWEEILLSAQVQDEAGKTFPRKKVIQFLNCEIKEEQNKIIVKTFGSGGGSGGSGQVGYYLDNVTIPVSDFVADSGYFSAQVRMVGLLARDFASVIFPTASSSLGKCSTENGYLKVSMINKPIADVKISIIKIDKVTPWIDDSTNVIHLIKGTDYEAAIAITDETGNQYTPTAMDKLVFTMCPTLESSTVTLQKELINSKLTLKPSDTADLMAGEYIYDVVLKTEDKKVLQVIQSQIYIEEGVGI